MMQLSSPETWAQDEFGFAELGDTRRNKRLVFMAANLASNPSGTLPEAFGNWAELKAAYRFFNQRGVTFDNIVAAHIERTRQSCREPGEYLLIEDSTLLDYSKRTAEDLGFIGDGTGRGFELHTALAVRVEAWNLEQRPESVVMGLFGQQCARPRRRPKGESYAARLRRPRRSQRWALALKQAGRPPEDCQWIYIADRESDFYEPMDICRKHGVDFIIRGFQDRRLADGKTHLDAALQARPVMGRTTVEVPRRDDQPKRMAIVEIRSVRVDFDGPWRPGGWQKPLYGVGVVEVREVDPPQEVSEPLHWILLSSMPCETWVEVQRIIGRYMARWGIEEYHKALKTGTRVEDSQMERADRLEPLIGVLAIVAVRLLSTKFLARTRPESCEAAESFGPQALKVLEKKCGIPKGGWTNRNLLVAIAKLGGFIGRKSDGMPGWQTIWRGWQRLIWITEGANLMIE
jgi:hypothetical protein